MNCMDLRVLKTKKNIRDAFLELRKNLSLEEIKVNALCEKAMVNKTTYFQDIDMMLTDSQRFINVME